MVRKGDIHYAHKSALSAAMNGVGMEWRFPEGKHSIAIGEKYTGKSCLLNIVLNHSYGLIESTLKLDDIPYIYRRINTNQCVQT